MKKTTILLILLILISTIFILTGCETLKEIYGIELLEEEWTPLEEIGIEDIVNIDDNINEEIIEDMDETKTCYKGTSYKYNGEINRSCYFYSCRDECEEINMKRCFDIFGEFDEWCAEEYLICERGCYDDMEDMGVGDLNQYNKDRINRVTHVYECFINETVEEIFWEDCY